MNDFLEFLCFLNLNINFLNENKLRKIEIVYILFLRVNCHFIMTFQHRCLPLSLVCLNLISSNILSLRQRVRLPMFSIRKRSVLIIMANMLSLCVKVC